jgi:hypothetical protein
MSLQVIHSTNDKPEFVLLPILLYEKLSEKIRADKPDSTLFWPPLHAH